ncbi:uncharacterized protein F54H12.2-like [Paramacrobiotus metropolitanus]|uniref:uncharacterized protein F54H12.2-like n=1 Tax=Paramacrobiotus metropolitanus TaxID=2943436 RepID=UPI0024455FB6|nr:uncharacterized protein F54H12.2-like [Paramacrobiotus metropolitanus]
MAMIEANSEPSMLLESHLFYLPATLTERWNTKDYDIGPAQATFDSANDIVFTIAPSLSELVSLADIRFKCDLHVTNKDGADLKDSDCLAPINNILHSLFQSVTVSIGGRNVTDTSTLYHYRAYLESLLGFTDQAQKSQLTLSGFALDNNWEKKPGHVTSADAAKVNRFCSDGANKRRDWLQNMKPLQLSGKLHCDLFQQEKPLLPGVELTIKLVRNKNEVVFVADSDSNAPKAVAIRNPRLQVRKFEPSPDYFTAMSKQLLSNTVKYHIERVVMREHTLILGQQQAVWSNIVMGQLPKIMIFGLVPSRSFAGEYASSPFNFTHCNLTNIVAEIDGQLFPTQGYNLNYEKGSSIQGYEGLLDTLERLNEGAGELPIDREQYNKGGFCLYGFDFTRGHTGRGAMSLSRHGNLNIHLKFAKGLEENVVCVAMLVFDNVIEINNNRQVIFDFAP